MNGYNLLVLNSLGSDLFWVIQLLADELLIEK